MGLKKVDEDTAYALLLVIAVSVAHMWTSGVAYCIGLYYVVFLEVFQHSSGVTAWVGSLNAAVVCGFGPVSSLLVKKIGVRFTIITGGLMSSLGLLITSFATNIYVVFASFGILTGECAGYSFVFTAATLAILGHFDTNRPLMIAVTSAGVGINTFCYPLLAQWLCETYEWRGTLMITSALTLHVVAAGAIIRDKPTDRNQIETSPPPRKKVPPPPEQRVWCSVDYWILHLNSILFCFGFSTFFTHLAAFSASLNMDRAVSAMLISAHGISGMVSRLLLGFMATCKGIDVFWLYIVSVVIAAASNFLMTIWTSLGGLMTCVVLHSVSYASYGPLMNEVSCRIIGKEQLTYGFGLLMVSLAIGTLLGPPCAGWLYDATGIYANSFHLSGTALLAATAVMMSITFRRNRHAPLVDQMTVTTVSTAKAAEEV
ncbi:hypothetical protein CAPTEDRAFT_227106 [Capitella teleta]|uniref:Major facilitator superfamily (MFS) profile domain-containing protein n=1 Tax=Capitella teleta TaxID=283909 RepID=R7TTJ2_CAPTE|nr:hypothetical protein CAPTEDRAFT_227106 [Capitella teleta]|eukprot:ELT97233.1 hypothetical protein CAPTEDRAFT_227106 [Capitella teleta]